MQQEQRRIEWSIKNGNICVCFGCGGYSCDGSDDDGGGDERTNQIIGKCHQEESIVICLANYTAWLSKKIYLIFIPTE